MPATAPLPPPVYGNYHGYYNKRVQLQSGDQRLAQLPKDTFRDKRVLDIGCNEGWVTCEIAQTWGASSVTGVDIDEMLIRAAWKRRRALWSLQQPVDDGNDGDGTVNYFPASLLHTLGPLPLPPRENPTTFPHNLTFTTHDFMGDPSPKNESLEYEVVIAFSVTKWIHLNHGDSGIKSFFERVFACLSPGGLFLLEPQGWDGYAKAKRMSETLRQNYKTLQLRPEGFHDLLTKLGFELQTSYQGDASAAGGFQRELAVYCKLE